MRPQGSPSVQLVFCCLLAIAVSIDSGCHRSPTGAGRPPYSDLASPHYSEPIWSPDGMRVGFNHTPVESIFAGSDGFHHYVLQESLSGFWMINADGSNLRRVLPYTLDYPDWSSDGGWVAYGKGGDIWKMKTALAGLDSSSAEQLTFQGFYFNPAWDESTRRLAFYRPTGATAGLYTLGAGGGFPQQIGGQGWRDPDWSPDGSRLVFVGTIGNEYGIASSDTSGLTPHMLTTAPVLPQAPKWSPDGSMIGFTARSAQTQVTHLWVMNSDGTNIRQVGSDAVGVSYSWGPDSKHIAYVRFSLSDFSYVNGTIWIADLNTGSARQLTFNGPGGP